MKTIRSQHFTRVLVGILTLLGWIALSNHCALAGVLSKTPKGGHAACCQKNPQSPTEKAPCPQLPQGCCKTLNVVTPDGAKLPDKAQADIVKAPLDLQSSVVILPSVKIYAAPETGPPPDSPTFAELVLQRSLHSHAPPFAA